MDILQATENFLTGVQDGTSRQASINLFDTILLDGRHTTQEDVKKATLFLLTALQKETTQAIKDAIFWPLATAATYYNVTEYIDWDVIIDQLPLLSEVGLMDALEVLYASTRRDDIEILKQYLDHPSLTVRVRVLNVICQIRWNSSDFNRETEAKIRSKHYHYIQYLINNPKRRKDVSEAELEEQFRTLRNEVMRYIQTWFEKYR